MTRVVVNARLRLGGLARPPAEPLRFHRELPGYRPTPVRVLPDVPGVARVLVKDESARLGLTSFKALGASWAIERVLRQDPDVRTLVAASAGNHGLAVASSAAARGLGCRIYLPAGAAPARAEPIAATGARLVRVDGDYDAAVAAAAGAARESGTALVADVSDDSQAETARWVIDGYSTLFAELTVSVDVVLVPAGVGSLAAAAAEWAAQQPVPPRVIAVEPVTAACVSAALAAGRPVRIPTRETSESGPDTPRTYVGGSSTPGTSRSPSGTSMAGLDCGTASAVAWASLRDGLAGAISVCDPPVHQAMRDLAGWGLAIGDCGAAPLAALRALLTDPGCRPLREAAGLGPDSRVLLLATEGVTDPASYRTTVGRPAASA